MTRRKTKKDDLLKINKLIYGITMVVLACIFTITSIFILSITSSIDDESYYEETIRENNDDTTYDDSNDNNSSKIFRVIAYILIVVSVGMSIWGILLIIKVRLRNKRKKHISSNRTDSTRRKRLEL